MEDINVGLRNKHGTLENRCDALYDGSDTSYEWCDASEYKQCHHDMHVDHDAQRQSMSNKQKQALEMRAVEVIVHAIDIRCKL